MNQQRARLRDEERQARRTRVIAALIASLPDLTEATAAVVLQSIGADRGIPLRRLDEHLAAHPDAVISGDPRCPIVVVRIAHELRAAGHIGAVPPGCAGCGRTDVGLPRGGPDGRRCHPCAARASKKPCARCGRTARILARRAEGGICSACYRTDPQVIEECAGCGRTRQPAVRRQDGKGICGSCWTRPTHRCSVCGQDRPATIVHPDGAVCEPCYRRQRPKRVCGRCGQLRAISKRATDTSPDLCYSCNLGSEESCSVCGRMRPCRRGPGGGWVCQSCKPRFRDRCCRCDRVKPVHARWPAGPVCENCYCTLLDSPATCPQCGQLRVLIPGTGLELVCGPCSGLDFDPRCATCMRPGRHYVTGRCAHCVLDERLRVLLGGPDGTIDSHLAPVREALAATRRPRNLIKWIDHSPTARLLAQATSDGRPLTHKLLDEFSHGRHEYFVRQLLVHTGVLPERNEGLERLPAWLNKTLSGQPAEHAQLIRPFVHWFLLRRARRRAAIRARPADTSYLRNNVTVALELLAWLDEQHLTLDRLDQATLDTWLVNGNTHSYNIRHFLRWAAAQGLATRLIVPLLPEQDPAQTLDEDQHWQLLHRCLTDHTMPLTTRCAGALVLLFGLPVSRIRHVTTDQLLIEDDNAFLRIGPHPLLLPPKLAHLLQQLADTHPSRSRFAPKDPEHRWFFSGTTPGQPMSEVNLRVKFRDYGLTARPARNAALIALAADLPAQVLADLLDLHPNTTVRWTSRAKRDWTTYLAARTADR
jgi:hypothetical protein